MSAPDPARLRGAVDRVLELVSEALRESEGPAIRDWNDRVLVEAFTRAHRCLRSIRELAGRDEADDAYVLTRALVSLTLQYLWLVSVDDEEERHDRLRGLQLKWAKERATLGEELTELGYVPADVEQAEQFRAEVAKFRARADELERECVRRMPSEKDMALRLDRDLKPTAPRFFELIYARIYRTTSHVSHFGLGAALAGIEPDNPGELVLIRTDPVGAADALGLALLAYAASSTSRSQLFATARRRRSPKSSERLTPRWRTGRKLKGGPGPPLTVATVATNRGRSWAFALTRLAPIPPFQAFERPRAPADPTLQAGGHRYCSASPSSLASRVAGPDIAVTESTRWTSRGVQAGQTTGTLR
jgi:hypothetical protein